MAINSQVYRLNGTCVHVNTGPSFICFGLNTDKLMERARSYEAMMDQTS